MSYPPVTPDTTVVLTTSSNQGIGLEMVKQLTAQQPDYHIILSSRRPNAVKEAAAPLQAQGLRVSTLILEITSGESIKTAAAAVEAEFGRLDVLINNSAITGLLSSNQASILFQEEIQYVNNSLKELGALPSIMIQGNDWGYLATSPKFTDLKGKPLLKY